MKKNFLLFFEKIILFLFKLCSRFSRINLSFSSDGEDVLVNKLLSHLEKGVYIDIGSNDPVRHNNTYYFYLKGWRGVLIEPNKSYSRTSKLYRSRDIFLNYGVDAALGEGKKQLDFYEYDNFPDNNHTSKDRARELLNKYNRKHSRVTQCTFASLDSMLSDVEKAGISFHGSSIDYLNVDIEGDELSILEFLFSKDIYPKVISVEQLGLTCVDVEASDVFKLCVNNGYLPYSKGMFSVIYSLKKEFQKSIFSNEFT